MMTKAWIWAMVRLRAMAGDERGVSLIEYALIIAFAVLVVVVMVRNFANSFVDATNYITEELKNAVSAT